MRGAGPEVTGPVDGKFEAFPGRSYSGAVEQHVFRRFGGRAA